MFVYLVGGILIDSEYFGFDELIIDDIILP